MSDAIICYMASSDQIQTKMLSKNKRRKATKNSKYFLLPFLWIMDYQDLEVEAEFSKLPCVSMVTVVLWCVGV